MVLLLCAGFHGAVFASGVCTTAEVAEPILLPEGTEHPAGSLTLCVSHHFSPVTTLHKTYVNGRQIGLLQSRRGESEGGAEQPFFVFHRDHAGKLHLYGYASPQGNKMITYTLNSPGAERLARSRAARRAEDRKLTPDPTPRNAVFLAANVN